tara:strand:- start:643 stop:774 length:132 start_codon:yes stop_codon:yes gene_type:complete
MVGLALLALAGRKYIRDKDIKIPRMTDMVRESPYEKTLVKPGK